MYVTSYDWKEHSIYSEQETAEILAIQKKLLLQMNHGQSGTIPFFANLLNVEEQKIAWALQGLVEICIPKILINNQSGEDYFQNSLRLAITSQKPFDDSMLFYSRLMR